MAAVKGSSLGNLSGKLGTLSARTINGRTIMAARPASFKDSRTQKHADAKQKFKVTRVFASKITALPVLYTIWKQKKKPLISVTNSIFQKNYSLSSTEGPTLKNIITPDGFNAPVTAVSLAEGKLSGSLAAINTVAVIDTNCSNLSINGVICLTDPISANDSYYKIISISKEVNNFDFTQPYNFEIELGVEAGADVAKYGRKIIYLAIAIKSADDKIIKYSNSYSAICS
jgi:hypothetical protein